MTITNQIKESGFKNITIEYLNKETMEMDFKELSSHPDFKCKKSYRIDGFFKNKFVYELFVEVANHV